jgi:hypothetical protein
MPDEKDPPNLPDEDAYAPPTGEPLPQQEPGADDPVDELKKGFGMLLRAAKHAVDKLPTDKIEEAVKTGAKQVEHAVDNFPTEKIGTAVKAGVRVAENVAKRIPAEKIGQQVGDAVKTGAKEVGKAIGNVAEAVERTVTGKSTPPDDKGPSDK